MKISPEGEIIYSVANRKSVTGTFDASISIRSHGATDDGLCSILHVSGNFAKFLQGHNIIGSDNLIAQVIEGLNKICSSLEEEGICLADSIDWSSVYSGEFEVDRIDINYLFELPTKSDVNAWLRAAEYTSHTRHGRPRNEKGTVYWGKNSRRWSIKAYCKADEINARGDHRLPEVEAFEPLREFVQNKLRIEVTIRQLELRTANIKHANQLTTDVISNMFASYLARLQMTEKTLLNDEQALKLPRHVQSTYHLWKAGMQPFDILPKNTFYRHRRALLEHGIDISNSPPQAMTNVIPLVRVLEAKPTTIPLWAYQNGLIAAA